MTKTSPKIIEENYRIIGIRTKMNIAKFLWQINSFFGINFSQIKDIKIINKKINKTILFPVFETEKANIIYKIAVNNIENTTLIRKYKIDDFFLFVVGYENENEINLIIETIIKQLLQFNQIEEVHEIEKTEINLNDIRLIFRK